MTLAQIHQAIAHTQTLLESLGWLLFDMEEGHRLAGPAKIEACRQEIQDQHIELEILRLMEAEAIAA